MAVPSPDVREATTTRGATAWRPAAVVLGVLLLLLGGLLVRATRPGPTHAAGIYSQWTNLMYGVLAPHTIDIWTGRRGIQVPYAYNQRAMGMLSGVYIEGDTNTRLQHMMSDLSTINNQLDLMLSTTLQETNRVKQQSDARYVRTVIRQDILAPLSGARSSSAIQPLAQVTSDDRALAMTPQLCRIAATVELRTHQRFYQGNVPAGLRSDLFAACAQDQVAP